MAGIEFANMKTWGVAALAAIAVVTLVLAYHRQPNLKSKSDSASSALAGEVTVQSPAAPPHEGPQARKAPIEPKDKDPGPNAGEDAPSDGLANDGLNSQNRASNAQKKDASPPNNFELMDARTAVGRAFPVSQSVAVRRDCQFEGRPLALCLGTWEFLGEFSKEPRNIPWARDKERRLEAAINALGQDKYSIRAIECRSTRCAVEVSGYESYVGDLDGDPDLKEDLMASDSTWGYEKGPNGERIVVTVMTFERR